MPCAYNRVMPPRRSPATAASSTAPDQPLAAVEHTTRRLGDLSVAAYNPRRQTERAKAGLRASLGEFGMVENIVVNVRPDGELRIVGGHQRFGILLEDHGADFEAPVALVRLSDVKEKALNLALNNPALAGDFTRDVDRIVAELEGSDEMDAAMRQSLMFGDLLTLVARDDAAAAMRNLNDADDDGDDEPRGEGGEGRPTGRQRDGEDDEDEPRGGMGRSVVSYTMIFDDEAQQDRFYSLLRSLRDRYGDSAATIGARLDRFIAETEHLWRGRN